jgi:hypothetical protein
MTPASEHDAGVRHVQIAADDCLPGHRALQPPRLSVFRIYMSLEITVLIIGREYVDVLHMQQCCVYCRSGLQPELPDWASCKHVARLYFALSTTPYFLENTGPKSGEQCNLPSQAVILRVREPSQVI